jgi:hypothetical protein
MFDIFERRRLCLLQTLQTQSGWRLGPNRAMLLPMADLLKLIWCAVIGLFRSKALLEAEIILALRHQLNVLRRKSPKRLAFAISIALVSQAFITLRPEFWMHWRSLSRRR